MDRAVPVHEVLFLLERLARNTVPPLVGPFVQIAGVGDLLNKRGHTNAMSVLSSADEVIERDTETLPDRSKRLFHLVAERQRLQP